MKLELSDIKEYLLLYICFLVYSFSTICAKLAARQDFLFKVFVFLLMEIFFLGIYAVMWQQVLKKFSLVTAMANKGIVVVFNLIWSVLLFKEVATIYNILGAIVILGGIWVVSLDG